MQLEKRPPSSLRSPPPGRCSWRKGSPSPLHSWSSFSPRLRPQPPGEGGPLASSGCSHHLVSAAVTGGRSQSGVAAALCPRTPKNELNRSGPGEGEPPVGSDCRYFLVPGSAAGIFAELQPPARIFHSRSADFQSAVPQNYILQVVRIEPRPRCLQHFADCKSAIQQIENLRYEDFGLSHCAHQYEICGPGESLARKVNIFTCAA